MDLELLDQLEEKVDAAVSTVQELRDENGLLKEEIEGLEEKTSELTRSLEEAGASKAQAEALQARCQELEKKLTGVKGRVQSMVEKMKSLEG